MSARSVMGQTDMTLHDAICDVLNARGEPMTSKQIANEVASRKLYKQKDGALTPSRQVSARASAYPQLFIKEGRTIALKRWRQ